MKRLITLVFVALILAFSTSAVSFAAPGIPPAPSLRLRVVDSSDTLTTDQISSLSLSISSGLPSDYKMAVLMISALDRYPMDLYSTKVSKNWKVGVGDEKSALIIIAKAENEVSILSGDQVKNNLTDAEITRITNDIIKPRLINGQYFEAVDRGISSVAAVMQGKGDPNVTSGWIVGADSVMRGTFNYSVFAVIPLVWFGAVLTRSKKFHIGSILGLLAGVGLSFLADWTIQSFISIGVIFLIGLVLDIVIARNYKKRVAFNKKPAWWAGGYWSSRPAAAQSGPVFTGKSASNVTIKGPNGDRL